MDIQALARALASSRDEDYFAALGSVATVDEGDAASLVGLVAAALGADATFSGRAASQRLSTVLSRTRLTERVQRELVMSAQSFPAGMKNAVSEVIDPALRRTLSRTTSVAIPAGISGNHLDVAPALPQEPGGTVLLLSAPNVQDANKSLLHAEGYEVAVVSTLSRLIEELDDGRDVCGCIVDRSFLQDLSTAEQEQAFDTLAGFSTFLWLRVDDHFLKLAPEALRNRLRTARMTSGPVAAGQLSLQGDGTVRATELHDLGIARDTLRLHESVRFVPDNLTAEEAHLVVATTRTHNGAANPVTATPMESLRVRFIHGGRSGARTALVSADGHPTFFIKVHDKAQVLGEIERFRTFIQPAMPGLLPQPYFHGAAALLALTLVEGASGGVASTLEEVLIDLWDEELFARTAEQTSKVNRRADRLKDALRATVSQLLRLNKRAPGSGSGLLSYANPGTKELERLDGGAPERWGLSADDLKARALANELLASMSSSAVVHGDLQPRNILVRGDVDPHLIDFAASGAGHPAVDLVRLELALLLAHARIHHDEDWCRSLQAELSAGADEGSLAQGRDVFLANAINRVCLAGCVAARDGALAAVEQHGGGQRDYLAVKCLVAWQSLVMHGRQYAVARGTLRALTPMLLS